MKRQILWTIVQGLALGVLLVLLGVTGANAQEQEVVLEPGDTLTVLVLELPPIEVPAPETVYVDVPGLPTFECPPDWICTPPVVEVDTIPPLPVSGVTLSIDGNELVVEWTNRPNPDRGGVGTDGYYVAHGFQEAGHDPEPTVDVASTPYRVPLVGFGERWACVTPHNAAGVPSASCNRIAYDAPPLPPADSIYLLHVTVDRSGSGVVADGDEIRSDTYYIHLERVDGSWSGRPEAAIAGVDSVVFFLDGFHNRERLYPYETPSGNFPVLLEGRHTIEWEVFGDETDSGSVTLDAITDVGVVIPHPDADFIDGYGCALGDLRCTVRGDTLDLSIAPGRQELGFYYVIEFPPDPRLYVMTNDGYTEIEYDDATGWICLKVGGSFYAADPPNVGLRSDPPPTCPSEPTNL